MSPALDKNEILKGICSESAEVLKNSRVSLGTFYFLRKLKPMRRIEVAELMVAAGNYSVPYVKALFTATSPETLP
jgi:hypothetical protein